MFNPIKCFLYPWNYHDYELIGHFKLFNSYLNDSNEAHIVVVAKDSGTPARQTSVAVVVSFGEDSNKYGRRLSGFENIEDDALTLAISLGLVVVVFLIVIVSLIAYICNSKVRTIGFINNYSFVY